MMRSVFLLLLFLPVIDGYACTRESLRILQHLNEAHVGNPIPLRRLRFLDQDIPKGQTDSIDKFRSQTGKIVETVSLFNLPPPPKLIVAIEGGYDVPTILTFFKNFETLIIIEQNAPFITKQTLNAPKGISHNKFEDISKNTPVDHGFGLVKPEDIKTLSRQFGGSLPLMLSRLRSFYPEFLRIHEVKTWFENDLCSHGKLLFSIDPEGDMKQTMIYLNADITTRSQASPGNVSFETHIRSSTTNNRDFPMHLFEETSAVFSRGAVRDPSLSTKLATLKTYLEANNGLLVEGKNPDTQQWEVMRDEKNSALNPNVSNTYENLQDLHGRHKGIRVTQFQKPNTSLTEP